MATQQRSVIVTAIVLAIILGGALVWLLNRTPARQLTTQAPNQEQSQSDNDALIAQVQQATATPTTTTPLSPTEPQTGAVQGVAATAPTGPADVGFALSAAALGSGGLLALSLTRFVAFRS